MKNADILKRMATHAWIWGGTGLLLRSRSNAQTAIGLSFLAYGVYDLQRQLQYEEELAQGLASEQDKPLSLFAI